MKFRYVFLDLETAGVDEMKNPVLQIGIIVTDRRFRRRLAWRSYIRPPEGMRVLSDRQIKEQNAGWPVASKKALQMNGLKLSELRNAPTELEVMQKLETELAPLRKGGYKLVFAGYNCPFDQKFLLAMSARTGIVLEFFGLAFDVLDIVWGLLWDLPGHKLTDILEHFGITTDGAHDALVDCENTVTIAQRLLKSPRISHIPFMFMYLPIATRWRTLVHSTFNRQMWLCVFGNQNITINNES